MALGNQKRDRRPRLRLLFRTGKQREAVQPRIRPYCNLRFAIRPRLVRAFGLDVDSDWFGAQIAVSCYVVPRFGGLSAVEGERFKRGPGLLGGLIWLECDDVIDDATRKAFLCAGECFGVDSQAFSADMLAFRNSQHMNTPYTP